MFGIVGLSIFDFDLLNAAWFGLGCLVLSFLVNLGKDGIILWFGLSFLMSFLTQPILGIGAIFGFAISFGSGILTCLLIEAFTALIHGRR